jgi:hypothetical protein
MGEDLGREFVASGQITEAQLATAAKMQGETGGSLLRMLVRLGFLKEQDLLQSLAKREGLRIVSASDLKPDAPVISKLPRELLEKNDLLPIGHTASHLTLAVADPGSLPAVEELRFRTGLEVEMVLASARDIQRVLSVHFASPVDAAQNTALRQSRRKMEARDVARQIGVMPAAADAARAIAEIDASPAKLMRAIAALLVEKRVITAAELKDWVHRLE